MPDHKTMLSPDIYNIISDARTLGQLHRLLISHLQSVTNSPALEAEILLGHFLKISKTDLILNQNDIVTKIDTNIIAQALSRRLQHEPIAYITGEQEFWGLSFTVGPDTLIPRADSETLVEQVSIWLKQQSIAAPKVADLGTGSGCLLLSILHDHPNAIGTGLDQSHGALAVAKGNANRLGLDKRSSFAQSNWFSALQSDQQFDCILSNPPYIESHVMATLMPDVKNYEPHSALEAGKDGLDDYRLIIPTAADYLKSKGLLALEIGYNQQASVTAILQEHDYQNITCHKDLAGQDRCITATAP